MRYEERARKILAPILADGGSSGDADTDEDMIDHLAEEFESVWESGRRDGSLCVPRILEILHKHHLDVDTIFWHGGPAANCNDLFYWACADAEDITSDNVDRFATALQDAADAGDVSYGPSLFASRERKLRPQRPCYKGMPEPIAALFNAAGPERDRKTEG